MRRKAGEFFEKLSGETEYTVIDLQFEQGVTDRDVERIRGLAGETFTVTDNREANSEVRGAYYSFALFLYGFLAVIALIFCLLYHQQYCHERIRKAQAVWCHASDRHDQRAACTYGGGGGAHLCGRRYGSSGCNPYCYGAVSYRCCCRAGAQDQGDVGCGYTRIPVGKQSVPDTILSTYTKGVFIRLRYRKI